MGSFDKSTERRGSDRGIGEVFTGEVKAEVEAANGERGAAGAVSSDVERNFRRSNRCFRSDSSAGVVGLAGIRGPTAKRKLSGLGETGGFVRPFTVSVGTALFLLEPFARAAWEAIDVGGGGACEDVEERRLGRVPCLSLSCFIWSLTLSKVPCQLCRVLTGQRASCRVEISLHTFDKDMNLL